MSDHSSHHPADAGGPEDFLEDGIPHVNARGYLTGFLLSVILTAIPFWLVMGKVLPTPAITTLAILVFAVIQIVVHMVYFLHMDTRSEGGWNLLALIFTAVLVVIVMIGTLWVMHNMNANMMPAVHDMQSMP